MIDGQSSEMVGLERALRARVLAHIDELGLREYQQRSTFPDAKDLVRRLHRVHREQFLLRETAALRPHLDRLLPWFAEGGEVAVESIAPLIVPVDTERQGLLFRLATLVWSVPVSRGYGRRMRFLVIDEANQKLIGVFALGDPVFNLRVRDEWIGWSVKQREERLVNVMDGYVIGAVPPYSFLLGGKLRPSRVRGI
jgi:hypothetical protein